MSPSKQDILGLLDAKVLLQVYDEARTLARTSRLNFLTAGSQSEQHKAMGIAVTHERAADMAREEVLERLARLEGLMK